MRRPIVIWCLDRPVVAVSEELFAARPTPADVVDAADAVDAGRGAAEGRLMRRPIVIWCLDRPVVAVLDRPLPPVQHLRQAAVALGRAG